MQSDSSAVTLREITPDTVIPVVRLSVKESQKVLELPFDETSR